MFRKTKQNDISYQYKRWPLFSRIKRAWTNWPPNEDPTEWKKVKNSDMLCPHCYQANHLQWCYITSSDMAVWRKEFFCNNCHNKYYIPLIQETGEYYIEEKSSE